jgi:hypothetical protein
MTSYERGEKHALDGGTPQPLPKGDARWEERLFYRGWADARDRLNHELRETKMVDRRSI